MTRATNALRSLEIRLVRTHRRVGWASLAGLALMFPVAGLVASAWNDHRFAIDSAARMTSSPSDASDAGTPGRASLATTVSAVDGLPATSDLPRLLTAIEATAVDNHLGWSAADYRLKPASDREPASLEIRARFVGTYPQIRRMVAQVLDRIPAATFRQLSFARTSSDTAEVEAKVVIAILLADGPAGADKTASSPRRTDASQGNVR
jgi:hypothetical protein